MVEPQTLPPPSPVHGHCRCQGGPAFLVVALTNQVPSLDQEVPGAVSEALRQYRGRLEEASPESLTIRLEGRNYDLFQPQDRPVLGLFDNAICYLADDIDHVLEVAGHAGAARREYLFGALPAEPTAAGLEVLNVLLADEETLKDQKNQFIGMLSVKLGDHLKAAFGPRFVCAVIRWIEDQARNLNVPTLVVPSWAWADLYVFSTTDRLTDLLQLIEEVESLPVGKVQETSTSLLPPLSPHSVPQDILHAWTKGTWPRRGDSTASPEDLVQLHACFALRFHLARTHRLDVAAGDPPLRPPPQDRSQDSDHPLTAVYLIQVKPGHRRPVKSQAQELANQWRDLGWGAVASIEQTLDGDTVRVMLRLQSNVAPEHLLPELARVSRYLRRPNGEVNLDILDLTTVLDLVDTTLSQDKDQQGAHPRRDPTTHPRGYTLLGPPPRRKAERLERDLLTLIGFDAVGRAAVLTWLSNVRQCAASRETFGALTDVLQTTELVRRELLSLVIQETPGELSASESWEKRTRLRQMVHQMTKFGQLAYLQRIQYTPQVHGGLSLTSELPLGVNQLAQLVTGVAEAVLALAHVDHRNPAFEPHDIRQRGSVLTVFGQNNEVAVQHIGFLCRLKINILAAANPIALSLLNHELGHHIEKSEGVKEPSLRDRQATIQTLVEAWYSDSKQPERGDIKPLLPVLLSDLFAHTVWRRLGCEDNWDVFETQYLAAFAMGLVTDRKSGTGPALQFSWALALAQLWVQRELWDEQALDGLEVKSESIGEFVGELSPWFWPQITQNSGELKEVLDTTDLASIASNVWAILLALQDALSVKSSAEERAASPYLSQHHKLMRRLKHLERTLRALPSDSGPWETIDEDGFPTPAAFRAVRAALVEFTQRWRAQSNMQTWRSVLRESDSQRYAVSSTKPGYYADITGRMFLIGRAARDWWQRQRMETLVRLGDVAHPVRAGRIRRHFLFRREFTRARSFWPCHLETHGSTPLKIPGVLTDIGPGGAQVCVRSAELPAETRQKGSGERVKVHLHWPDKTERTFSMKLAMNPFSTSDRHVHPEWTANKQALDECAPAGWTFLHLKAEDPINPIPGSIALGAYDEAPRADWITKHFKVT